MKICYFGLYAQNYSRNHILIKGLRENGCEVLECNDRSHLIWGVRYWKLLKRFLQIKGWQTDVIFVGFPGQTDVPLAWILGKVFHKKVIFDAFFSVYNTRVFDRRELTLGSMRANFWFFVDWLSCFLADLVILDTNTHIAYFSKTFNIPVKKFRRVLVGTDTNLFRPFRVPRHKKFIVEFHGFYIPLQGVPIIIKAARLLKGNRIIQFKLLGSGVEYAHCKAMANRLKLSNLKFFKPIAYSSLPTFINSADVCLAGPFGSSTKADLVIPNKAYEDVSCGKPTVVGDSLATRELFIDKKNCLMIPMNNPAVLAEAIKRLYENANLRNKLGARSLLLRGRIGPKQTAGELLLAIKTIWNQ